jgi:hypothetical protein
MNYKFIQIKYKFVQIKYKLIQIKCKFIPNLTTSAFYLGETLHPIKQSQYSARFIIS